MLFCTVFANYTDGGFEPRIPYLNYKSILNLVIL